MEREEEATRGDATWEQREAGFEERADELRGDKIPVLHCSVLYCTASLTGPVHKGGDGRVAASMLTTSSETLCAVNQLLNRTCIPSLVMQVGTRELQRGGTRPGRQPVQAPSRPHRLHIQARLPRGVFGGGLYCMCGGVGRCGEVCGGAMMYVKRCCLPCVTGIDAAFLYVPPSDHGPQSEPGMPHGS